MIILMLLLALPWSLITYLLVNNKFAKKVAMLQENSRLTLASRDELKDLLARREQEIKTLMSELHLKQAEVNRFNRETKRSKKKK
ncbi:MAG: hypothetical protein HC896_14525 [Bacteroidales bacterium]|nr:hypothetical protein [Bacteroidales bacterium]